MSVDLGGGRITNKKKHIGDGEFRQQKGKQEDDFERVTRTLISAPFRRPKRSLAAAMSRHGVAFFSQAEDGIRDATVTGVQTCALPIWTTYPRSQAGAKPETPSRPTSASTA